MSWLEHYLPLFIIYPFVANIQPVAYAHLSVWHDVDFCNLNVRDLSLGH